MLAKTAHNVMSEKVDVMETIKLLDSISILGDTSQDISFIRRQKVKPALNDRYAHLSDLDYTDCTSKYVFGYNLSKSLNKARTVTNLKNRIQPHHTDCTSKYPFGHDLSKSLNKERDMTNPKNLIQPDQKYYSPNNSNTSRKSGNSFLHKGNNNRHGPTKSGWGRKYEKIS